MHASCNTETRRNQLIFRCLRLEGVGMQNSDYGTGLWLWGWDNVSRRPGSCKRPSVGRGKMHHRLGRQLIDMPLAGRGLDRAVAAVFRSALMGILSDRACQKREQVKNYAAGRSAEKTVARVTFYAPCPRPAPRNLAASHKWCR